ncbi:MAG: carnitine transporter [Chaenotheca gracillima]|nr:MAG: carnitine transporter [Chaenotheca gracillima]
MYIPRSLISHLYLNLLRTHHPLSPPVLLLVALEPDALCACRVLTALLKRDFIQHKIQPVAGYGDLAQAGERLVRPMRTSEGGSGGVVVCLGVGGLIDLGSMLGLDLDPDTAGEEDMGGVEVWVLDARRPWNLGNVFGGQPSSANTADGSDQALQTFKGVEKGRIHSSYKPGQGGIFVFDDGDIDDQLSAERDAYCALEQMPEMDEDDGASNASESESETEETHEGSPQQKKRKSWSDREEGEEESEDEDGRPAQRRRSNSSTSIPSTPSRPKPRGLLSTITGDESSASTSGIVPQSAQPGKDLSARTLRRRLARLRRKHEAVLHRYYELGTSYSEPISSLMYSLASELGREDNDLLWLAIVGVGSLELYGRSMSGVGISCRAIDEDNPTGNSFPSWVGERGERIRQILRDEVRRLNPPELADSGRDGNRGDGQGIIPTHARSPTDTSIRLSPEPRFLLIRHWSLYDSMLHSPYLSARLHIWSDAGRKRLHKLLAKMGVSLTQCKQSYTHMDMDLKKGLRQRLLKYAPVYGLDGLIPPAVSVTGQRDGWGFVRNWGFKACLSSTDVGVIVGAILEVGKSGVATIDRGGSWDRAREPRELIDEEGKAEGEAWVSRFWEAYDALENVDALKAALPTAMHLHRAILRTGTSLLEKKQIRHLRAFRMAVVKDGPDVSLFTHPAALTKLALWLGEAIAEQEREQRGKLGKGGKGTPLVVAGLNEARGVYVVVGLGGGGGVKVGGGQDEKEKHEHKEKKKREREDRRAARASKKEEKAAKRQRVRNDDDEDDDKEPETEEEDTESEEDDDDDSEDDEDDDSRLSAASAPARNRFGIAFQEVIEETGARVRIDSFEHCVVEIRKDDLAAFLEGLSMKAVIG